MDPLAPLSPNIKSKPKPFGQKEMITEEAKKNEAAKKALKEKDYAPPPPEWVLQPPIKKGGLAEKFKTGKCLGKGGFAICYEGELRCRKNRTESKIYALKVVKANMNQRKMEEKFRTELQIHAKMWHPNIVEFHRAFTFKESTFVVLELCSNGSVMDMVKKRRCLTLPEVRRFTVQLCGAIKYMHARNVIHRDLKMGNLFLDHEMNLKIGDFGLAAVLVSPEEYQKGLYEHAKARRTTLCGTPNYIAPEILEKGKAGHDYKVDIWAIGVIVFAMLVGVPPFQSTTQNEIYRRARNVEYDWPKPGKHQNDIPEEAKDLVYQLLKVDAEERPDPDQVVGHPFFAMHGGNAIPMVMEESFRRETPNYLDLTRLPRGDVMLRGTERLSLRILASQCGVGHLAGDVLPQPAVGGDIEISLFGQCQAEEDAGDAPIVPMPKDMVYVSKFASAGTVQIPAQSQSKPDPLDLDTIMEDAASSQSAPEHVGHSKAQRSLGIPSVPSHAATLRASHVPLSSTRSQQESVQLSSSQGRSRSRGVPAAGVRARRGLLSELPVRPTVKGPDAAGIEAKTLARKPRATRTKKVHVIEDAPIPDFKDIASSSEPSIRSILKGSDAAGIEAKTLVRNPRAARGKKIPASDNNIVPDSKAAASVFEPLIKLKCEDQINSDSDVKRRDVSARTRARIAVNVHNEMVDAPNNRKSSVEITDVRKASELGQLEKRNLLIGPGEVPECLPNTKPDEVLQQLQELHKQLEASLNGLGKAKGRSNKQDLLLDDSHDVKHRPVISKWVDYTNRYGIGYTLANGTVGCIFKADDLSCSTCVVVANAESHLLKRRNTTYPDKHQMVPAKGAPVEFVENCDDEGLKRVFVQPSQYQRNVSAAGVPDPLGPGFDMHDFQKRTRLAKWDKLGVYMTQSQFVSGEMDVSPSSSRRSHTAGPFAKFYQRLGNVGVWGFGDGSFQFNFPDHTKIFVSHGGTFLDFYHLTLEAAQTVKGGDKVTAAELSDRGVLSCPTTALLNGCYRGEDFKDLITANDLRSKVSFITDVVGIWVEEGGLGCMGTKNRMMWEGIGGKVEKGSKLVWVTAGAKGGDERYECRA